MKIHISGKSDYRFIATNPDNGYQISVGASKAIGGDESGFRPMQLLLVAMGSCAVIDVVSILGKSRMAFDSVDVEVDGEKVEGVVPTPFKTIQARFTVRGHNLDKEKVERAVKLSVEKYCSVAASLDPKIRIEAIAEILES